MFHALDPKQGGSMRRDIEAERRQLAEFEGNPHDGDAPKKADWPAEVHAEYLRALDERDALQERIDELEGILYGGRDEGDKGVLRWLQFYEEIASIWAFEARKSREAIERLIAEKNGVDIDGV
jgi:hypothetical protein